MEIWFTADTHYSHRNIIAYCGRVEFLSAEEKEWYEEGLPMRSRQHPDGWRPSEDTIRRMDDALIDLTNQYVGEKDVLWHLGDFCMPSSKWRAKELRNKIKCRTVNLTWGNHDDRRIGSVFNSCYERYRLKHLGYRIILSHYAQAVWQGSHRGAWMLYGHSHGTAEERLDEFMPGRRSIDVGVDNAYKVLGEYRPFSFTELLEIMKEKEGYSIDHHEEQKRTRS